MAILTSKSLAHMHWTPTQVIREPPDMFSKQHGTFQARKMPEICEPAARPGPPATCFKQRELQMTVIFLKNHHLRPAGDMSQNERFFPLLLAQITIENYVCSHWSKRPDKVSLICFSQVFLPIPLENIVKIPLLRC